MTNIDNCPSCKNSFGFSRNDIQIKLTITHEGKTYRVYHYKKACPNCGELLLMKIGMPSDNNGKWIVSTQ